MWSPPRRQWLFVITVLLLSSTAPSVLADDRLFVLRNSFLPADDVALGAEAARVIRAHVPLVKDRQISAFVAELGHRLVDQIPTALRQPAFRYSFDILDRMDATISALPGGPVFISRGLVQAAGSEKALATAIARQVSHITLRHGTAQATAGDRFQFGAIGGRDIAAVIAGPNHNLVVQGAAFSVASYFLTYGNEFERQADHLALQLLAGTGYGSSAVDVADGRSDRFRLMQTRLPDMPPVTDNPEPRTVGTSGRFGVLVPSGESRAVTAGDSLLLSVPANWDRLPAGNTVMFAPDGALVKTSGGSLSVTHGIQVGTARSVTGNLQADMQALLETLSRAGLNVRWRPSYQSTMVAGRNALTTTLVNVSGDTGAFEQVFVCAAHLPDGNMLYLIGLSPLDESGTYRLAFDRVRESIQPVR